MMAHILPPFAPIPLNVVKLENIESAAAISKGVKLPSAEIGIA